MEKYKRFGLEEREEMSLLVAQGWSLRRIAVRLGRSPSTVGREFARRAYGRYVRHGYHADYAQRRAVKKAASRRKGKSKLCLNEALRTVVREKLALYWSPEQIARFLKRTYLDPRMHASPETIYTYIYVLPRGSLRQELAQQLRQGREKRRTRGRSPKGKPCKLEDMLSIEERPAEVADRIVPGHWEGDLIIGRGDLQTALGTLVERTTRSLILVPLKSKKAAEVSAAFAQAVKDLPAELRLSLTYDQGREMAAHKLFTKETEMKVYFAHPHSPWERGTNENTNGLLRQFFPKDIDFRTVSVERIKEVQELMNGRPRKTLDWRTPKEAMAELLR